jgi:UDP-N-acetylmuramate--alanine ligase
VPEPRPSGPPAGLHLGSPRRIHIVGIGGSGMSAIATVLMAMGHTVSGSDAADSDRLRRLGAAGARVHAGHDARLIGEADMLAVSSAIPAGNVEVVAARQRSLPVWRRAEMLAAICAERRTIAVAGTHGKTSTSAMLAAILGDAGFRPSYIIGGDIRGVDGGACWQPGSEWLVVEADESDGTFLELGAEAVIITSIEADHLDHYGDEAALRSAFRTFASTATGPRVCCADDGGARALAADLSGASSGGGVVLTYGTSEGADVRIDSVTGGRDGSAFGVSFRGVTAGPFAVGAPGLYNIRNATAALTMAHSLGTPWAEAGRGLAAYQGVARRFERRGEAHGVTYVDDYGHLPGEVAAVLATAAAGTWGRVIAVFQPHRYSRTASLWPQFADAFQGADVLVVTDVYPAGEPARPGITGRLIADAVRAAHPEADVRYVPLLDEAAGELRRVLRPGDLCLTLGAGDVTTLPDRLLAPGTRAW